MNRSWVRFPQAAQKRPPLQGWTLSSMYEARAECAGECMGECAGYGVGVPRAGPRTLPLSRPGCLVCPWAAARPLAVRAASFARRPRRELRSVRRLEARPGPAAAHRHRSLALRQPPHWRWWGFSIRSLLVACRRRVGPSRSEIPPFGGGEVAVRGGVVLKVQTTSVKNAENGLLRARWSAFWAQRRLVGCVVRARTRCCER